jgi:hypothetical protein
VEDAEGHARPTSDRAARGRRSDGEGRDRPPPLRPLPPASGSPAERRRQKCTSAGRLRISRRSRLPAAGRAKARWIHRFASSISTRSGCCPCWFEKHPEGRSRRPRQGRWTETTCACRTEEQDAKSWFQRARTSRNSHCAPTMVIFSSLRHLTIASPAASASFPARSHSPAFGSRAGRARGVGCPAGAARAQGASS